MTYLSKHPQGLRESFITGGLAPIGRTPEEVYAATFKKVIERNKAYYDKYPQDLQAVYRLIAYINTIKEPIQLPGGGHLTVARFLGLGMAFGMHGGLHSVHTLILKMLTDLGQFGFFTRSTLTSFEQNMAFDVAPIYAILHEAIYCHKPGMASNWAAWRVGSKLEEYSWTLQLDQEHGSAPPHALRHFTGEMVFPFHFDTFPELMGMKEAAELLAKYDEWEELYDEEVLGWNEVPVYAASFIEDMYVDFELARETARKIHGIRVYETNGLYHNALRARADEVLEALFRLRDDPID